LTTRAVHIELVEEMSSSSFINALRRITAIRGPIKIFRSDRGTNFIGATDQIGIKSINVEDTMVKQHLDNVTTRRTRGGAAQSKRWAIIFTCLTTRAVHIELVEEMSSSSFINALRRSTAIRGPIKIFRSDRGTNVIGATDQIGIKSINVEDTMVKQHLDNTGSVWKFNPPHSSHMGGVWERMFGITRRILDGILLQQNKKGTHSRSSVDAHGGSISCDKLSTNNYYIIRPRISNNTESEHSAYSVTR
jgi:hypothetical protein